MFTILITTDFSLSDTVLQNTTAICGVFESIEAATEMLVKYDWKKSNVLGTKWRKNVSFWAYILPINNMHYLQV